MFNQFNVSNFTCKGSNISLINLVNVEKGVIYNCYLKDIYSDYIIFQLNINYLHFRNIVFKNLIKIKTIIYI